MTAGILLPESTTDAAVADQRAVIARPWRIASELIRRHPELRLIATHPADGSGDCLSIIADAAGRQPRILADLDRRGRLRIHARSGVGPTSRQRDLSGTDPEATVARIELDAGLIVPVRTPPATPAVLTYRVVAHFLAGQADHDETWSVRNEAAVSRHLARFPQVAGLVRQGARPDDLLGVPGYRFWTLLRGQEPVAILDTDGRVHLPAEIRDLPCLYLQHDRDLGAVVTAALGDLLP